MILAFNVQWALVKLLAMAGGAEALDDVPYDPDFLDEDWEFPGATIYWPNRNLREKSPKQYLSLKQRLNLR
ncbi:hypothetical protein OQA88_2686 [Cercophora sp. LCS_1]